MATHPRRQFLRGAAGFVLALPFLESLINRSARAEPTTSPKRFVAMATKHGGVWGSHMFPNDASLTEEAAYRGRNVRRGDLVPALEGGTASLSSVLTAASSKLTPKIASKLNVLRGLDITFEIGHNGGGHLGNFAANDGGHDGDKVRSSPMPTIDQVMAWSPSFYPNLDIILVRTMAIGTGVYSMLGEYGISWGWSSPQTKSGSIDALAVEHDSRNLFKKIFVPAEEEAPKRPLIVDRVMEDYKRLRNANTRLSKADRQRLDDHFDRLHELQRKLNVHVSCGDVSPPATGSMDVVDGNSSYLVDPSANAEYWSLFNDVIVAAFVCDTSRIATLEVIEQFSPFAGDWHNDIAHMADLPAQQETLRAAHQRFFENVFLDLVTKLDAVEEADGSTLLDSTLVHWNQESGAVTHFSMSQPIVTAGSAGGFFRTGSYLDYRDLNLPYDLSENPPEPDHAGLPYNQWFANVLQGMGVPPAEYQSDPDGGYGVKFVGEWMKDIYPSAVLQNMNELLPYLKA